MSPMPPEIPWTDPDEPQDFMGYSFGLNRRSFVQILGGGLLVVTSPSASLAQRAGRRPDSRARTLATRMQFAPDGTITVLAGKVEAGQGSRAQLSQAAAEELRVPVSRIRMLLADTDQVPDDGITAGSRTTPATVPAVRLAAAAARQTLVQLAARRWNTDPDTLELDNGTITHPTGRQTVTYTELTQTDEASEWLQQPIPSDIPLRPVASWRTLGTSIPSPNGRAIVTGAHQYPSDISRPGMHHGRILRPPSYGATLASIDLNPARAMRDVIVVRDGQFVGVTAPTRFQATQALDAIAATARWEPAPHPPSQQLFQHLREHAEGGIPSNPFADQIAGAKAALRESYHVAYVQHAPLEPRAAVAEWTDGKLTVWTATQNPFGVRAELMRALRLSEDRVRVIVPDFGGGFGGKHTGEAAVEAARLAQAAHRPVSSRWTREEEFTWAVFRPAALIDVEASLDDRDRISSWHFINVNSGGAAIDTPYRVPNARSRFIQSRAPLRHGSYRALAATANTFARECFMDQLAVAAGSDPLEFRLQHLEQPRLRTVLESAADRFGWRRRVKDRGSNVGVGLACGTEKGSYVAACVEVTAEPTRSEFTIDHVCQVFECGAVINPANLLAQVQGCVVMGLGPALHEEIRFENGRILNGSFRQYRVPRFEDIPSLDVHLLDRPDLPSAGGSETPIIAIAPAIANALFHATGIRLRSMPLTLPSTQDG
jgi:isoquinoline 1-oxidoreductase subunit beta